MTATPGLNGVLVVDKPAGPTSHDVVAVIRRTLGLRKTGHLGTLDPLATGVLPLVLGRATRLASLFADAGKQYDAVIRLGLVTDSYDIAGTVVGGSEAAARDTHDTEHAWPDLEAVRSAAEGFIGSYRQRPPPVSAKKLGGVRAYTLARRQEPVEIAPAPVTVESLTVLSVESCRVRCRIACSSGFYVRSLAHDLGTTLGCGGCLETLRRERHGPFSLEDAVPLADVVDAGAAATRLVPMGVLLPDLPRVVVNPSGARRAVHGNPLRPNDLALDGDAPDNLAAGRIRVLDEAGGLLAIAELGSDGLLRPRIVLV